jgi:hypothetical protein
MSDERITKIPAPNNSHHVTTVAALRPTDEGVGDPGVPSIKPSDVLFQEWFASGHSRKNLLTLLGGARNCLRLVVTKDMLRVTSWFPFSMITPFYDLEHVIPRDRITAVRRSWAFLLPSVLVTFRDAAGEEHTLWLFSWRPAEFLGSLGGEKPPTTAEPL